MILIGLGATVGVSLAAGALLGSSAAFAAGPGLGTAAPYSVLGGTTVTNTGPSGLSGDLGDSPGSSLTGFSTATIGGATHDGDAAAAQAQSDLTAAYTVAAGLTPTGTSLGSSLVGGVHGPGVYNAASALDLSGAVTLDAQGDPNAVFVFQIGAGFTTASSSSIVLIGAAQACNVFWQVGSSATLGTNSTFVGTVMALTSITVTTGTTVQGRALARNGAVTLDNNVFTAPSCATTPTTPATTVATSPATTVAIAVARGSAATPATRGQAAGAGQVAAAQAPAAASVAASETLANVDSTSTVLAATGTSRLTVLLTLGGLLLIVGLAALVLGAHTRPTARSPRHR